MSKADDQTEVQHDLVRLHEEWMHAATVHDEDW